MSAATARCSARSSGACAATPAAASRRGPWSASTPGSTSGSLCRGGGSSTRSTRRSETTRDRRASRAVSGGSAGACATSSGARRHCAGTWPGPSDRDPARRAVVLGRPPGDRSQRDGDDGAGLGRAGRARRGPDGGPAQALRVPAAAQTPTPSAAAARTTSSSCSRGFKRSPSTRRRDTARRRSSRSSSRPIASGCATASSPSTRTSRRRARDPAIPPGQVFLEKIFDLQLRLPTVRCNLPASVPVATATTVSCATG